MRVTYARRCRVTGEQLARALEGVSSDHQLNWGVGGQAAGSWINKPALLTQWADKGAALAKMETAGVNVPQTLSLEYARQVVGADFPVVIRPRSGTMQGRQIHVVRDVGQLNRWARRIADHRIAVFVDCPVEYRVHVIDGRCVKLQEKVNPQRMLVNGAYTSGQDPSPIRTHRNGWVFNLPRIAKSERQPIRDAGKSAVRALGLDIGAVDVGVDRSGRPVVYEVNSAPGLWTEGQDNSTFDKYVRWIGEVWGS